MTDITKYIAYTVLTAACVSVPDQALYCHVWPKGIMGCFFFFFFTQCPEQTITRLHKQCVCTLPNQLHLLLPFSPYLTKRLFVLGRERENSQCWEGGGGATLYERAFVTM